MLCAEKKQVQIGTSRDLVRTDDLTAFCSELCKLDVESLIDGTDASVARERASRRVHVHRVSGNSKSVEQHGVRAGTFSESLGYGSKVH